jgi:antibiotic biosynthesis monooxygenase (ABM) superfamily enzyme
LVTDFSHFEYSVLILSMLLLIISIYYIIPSINIYSDFLYKQHKKNKRKEMIKQIAMQKDINDEIEKELHIS